MNKSSLDSERVKGEILKNEEWRKECLPKFKLLYSSSFKSSPVMLKSLFWESCTDTSYIPLLFTTLETGDEF